MNTKDTQGKFVCLCGKKYETKAALSGHKTSCEVFQAVRKQKENEEREARRLPNGLFKCDNPDCTKEHDGSYGSGRFCSKHCRCSHNAKKQTHFAPKEELRRRRCFGFGRKPKEGGWKCSFCNLVFRTRRELEKHRRETKHPTNQGWSKGLTKETDERVMRISKSISKSLKEGYAFGRLKITDEMKRTLSIKRKDFLAKNPEKHPNRIVCNTKEHMTYPEQLVNDWLLSKKYKFESQFHWQYIRKDGTLHQRYVDFHVEDFKLFIEVDGNYWHKDAKDIDEAKDECAKRDGFLTLRIDPSKNVIQQLENFFECFNDANGET